MNIAILIPTIKSGGAEKQAVLLTSMLSANHDVHFILFCKDIKESVSLYDILCASNAKIHYLNGNIFIKMKSLFYLMKSCKIDVAFNYLTIFDVLGCCIERMAGIKTIFNGIRNSRLPAIKMYAERFTHNYVADYTIFNCYSGADNFIKRGFKSKKTIVIPNCFPNISEPIFHKNHAIKIIITIGRFEPQKDYETAIKAISELRNIRDDFKFIIIGHGKMEKNVKEWVIKYNIQDFTTIYVSPNNVQELLKRSDIFLSASLFEGTSNSIMESMNWSLPVVATDVGDNSRLIRNGHNGYLVSPKDYVGIAYYLNVLLSNYNLRMTMGINGNDMLKKYSIADFMNNYEQVLNFLAVL